SAVALGPGGELLCHCALTRHDHDDHVAHAGQAVTMPAARGHHLFTSVKRHLVDWARAHHLLGVYSEATARSEERRVGNECWPRAWSSDVCSSDLSAVALGPGGELLCHCALTRHDHDDHVAHAGQAVTMPAARGHHLFTSVKRHLVDWARAHHLLGVYSEATA